MLLTFFFLCIALYQNQWNDKRVFSIDYGIIIAGNIFLLNKAF